MTVHEAAVHEAAVLGRPLLRHRFLPFASGRMIAAVALQLWLCAISARAAASLELYGTFHAMGIMVTLAGSDDPDEDAIAGISYRQGSGPWLNGLALERVSNTRFVGSLFWLQSGTSYQVQVVLTDPDGGPLQGIQLDGEASTRSEPMVPDADQIWHVSPSGSGSDCTASAPCALSYALAQVQAGQAVELQGGVYYQGEYTLPRPGTTGAPIVVRSRPGEMAVLDGAEPSAFLWTSLGQGVYRTTVSAAAPHLVMANGQRLYPYQSLADLQAQSWGLAGFMTDGVNLYVHLAASADPNNANMTVSRFNYALLVEQHDLAILDLTFRHYGRGSWAKAIYLNNASDILVRGCTFANNDTGIGLKRASSRNVIEECVFSDTVYAFPWDAVKAGSELETGGIVFYDPLTGRGNVIRRNTFHDYFDGLSCCPATDNGLLSNETDIYENLVYRAGDDGVSADGACSNVRLWGNRLYDVLVGISLAPVHEGPVYALRNLIYRTGGGHSNYRGMSFKFNSGYPPSGTIFLFHNTVDAALADGDGFEIRSPGSWRKLLARNNIWAGTGYALRNANPAQPLDLDYDNLYTSQASELAWWQGLPDQHLRQLSELRAATGQEQHGFNLPPGFLNAAAGNYRLSPFSQLIDRGVVLPGVNDGFAGSGPDLGAFEFRSSGPAGYLPLLVK